jgi:TonB family protein
MEEKSEFRFLGFTTLSVLVHIGMLAALLFMNVSSEHKSEALTVEFSGDLNQSAVTAEPLQLQEVAITEKEIQPTPQPVAPVAKVETDEIVLPTKPAKKEKPESKVAKTLPQANRPAVQAKEDSPVEPEVTQEDSPVVLPIIQEAKIDAEPVSEELKEQEVVEDLAKIDAEEAEKMAAVQAQMQKEADEEVEKQIQEQNAQAELLQKKNAEEAARLAQLEEDRRKKEAALAAATAIAAEKAAQATAAKQGSTNSGSGNGDVRALADLKQMPGNSIPKYDSNDRLNQRKGDVAFLAMVSKEGKITPVKLLKSSGHRELDAKTLKAIKSWRFYPGQEGLVEIPMKWELTGEVQPIHGGRLRSGTNIN